jgi:hypothetical protein
MLLQRYKNKRKLYIFVDIHRKRVKLSYDVKKSLKRKRFYKNIHQRKKIKLSHGCAIHGNKEICDIYECDGTAYTDMNHMPYIV